jgi:GTPase SAR1 family protein
VGWKNSGKTTLIEKLIANFSTRGLNVAAAKHAHHAEIVPAKLAIAELTPQSSPAAFVKDKKKPLHKASEFVLPTAPRLDFNVGQGNR